jgi:hypothetical protein
MTLVTTALVAAVAASLALASPALADRDGTTPPAESAGFSVASVARDAPVDARVGDLTIRPALPGTGARRLAAASVRQDLLTARVSGTFVLDAEPTGATASYLRVVFGHLGGGQCVEDLRISTPTFGALAAGFSRSGATYRLDLAEAQAGYETWNCAVAGLTDDPVTVQYSVLMGQLTDIYAQPQPVLSKPELLDSSKIKLVRGVWTKLDVTVTNAGRVPADHVVISGAGKGVKVRTTALGWLNSGGEGTAKVKVKLTGKKRKARLVLVASAGAAQASREVTVRATRAPAPPTSGTWRSKDGTFTFKVRNGKVVGFRGHDLKITCQPPGDLATHYTGTLDFPTTKIARSGIVDDAVDYDKGDAWYNSWLEMRISGGRATKGHFAYVTAGSCKAIEDFTAKRVGR